MNTQPMIEAHDRGQQAPWHWPLPPQQARRLPAAPVGRWLRVDEGCAWLTRDGAGPHDAADQWLHKGQRLWLPPGSAWVAEGWPQARLSLLLAPQAPQAARPLQRPRGAFGVRFLGAALEAAGFALAAFSAAWTASRAQGSISMGDSIASGGTVQNPRRPTLPCLNT